jgi:hypothetical protein
VLSARHATPRGLRLHSDGHSHDTPTAVIRLHSNDHSLAAGRPLQQPPGRRLETTAVVAMYLAYRKAGTHEITRFIVLDVG